MAATVLLCVVNVFHGSVYIPAPEVLKALRGVAVENDSWRWIVVESRLPQTLTALLCGASLGTSGLLLQTTFRNPLAGPSILGITSGASLGVAIVVLSLGGVVSTGGGSVAGLLAVVAGALAGAVAVTIVLLLLARMVGSNLTLLIVGMMLSYLTSSVVSLLSFAATSEGVFSYTVWGMGSFSDVSLRQLPWFAAFSIVGLSMALLLVKPLDALMLGDRYAQNLGVNVRRTRQLLLLATGLLTATATAWCGPVAFIGLAVPHIARLMLRTSSHRALLPATMLCGATIALLCNIVCVLPHTTVIPVNAVTPLFGAPVILYILVRKRR